MMQDPKPNEAIKFWDAHFHIWDVHSGKHAPELVDSPFPRYTMKLHEEMLNVHGFELVGGTLIECLSLVPEEEAKWFSASLATHNLTNKKLQVRIITGGNLMSENIDAELAALKASDSRVVGMRQILNYEPSWPRNQKDFLRVPEFWRGYALLAKHDMRFDAQLNPSQFMSMHKLAKANPKVPVIINHLGTPVLKNAEQNYNVWLKGLKLLASLPHVAIKVSMLGYIDPAWDKNDNEEIIMMVHKVIELFGEDRVMFASNYPVDLDTFSGSHLLHSFMKILNKYTKSQQEKMLYRNGPRIYDFCPLVVDL